MSSNTNQSSGTNNGGQSSTTGGGSGGGEKSDYTMIKEGGWSSRSNFQASYGLSMTPDGIEEGNEILQSFRDADAEKYDGGGGKSK